MSDKRNDKNEDKEESVSRKMFDVFYGLSLLATKTHSLENFTREIV